MPASHHARHQARRRSPLRQLLWAVPVAVILSGGGLYLTGVVGPAPARATGASDTAMTGHCTVTATNPSCVSENGTGVLAPMGPPAPGTAPSKPGRHHQARKARHRAPARHHHHPTPPPATPTPTPTPTPPPVTHSPSPPPTTPPPPSSGGGRYGPAEAQVLALINQARAQAGLAGYSVTSGLVTSAGGHNNLMAAGCGLSHQCPGEPSLGDRETNAGVHWTAAGENIGEAGPITTSASAIAQAAVGLTQSMLDEKPPDDGHRLNILSGTYTHVGLVVVIDGKGTVWMTQDFSN
jgi:uncharacterized protein YkwD